MYLGGTSLTRLRTLGKAPVMESETRRASSLRYVTFQGRIQFSKPQVSHLENEDGKMST